MAILDPKNSLCRLCILLRLKTAATILISLQLDFRSLFSFSLYHSSHFDVVCDSLKNLCVKSIFSIIFQRTENTLDSALLLA